MSLCEVIVVLHAVLRFRRERKLCFAPPSVAEPRDHSCVQNTTGPLFASANDTTNSTALTRHSHWFCSQSSSSHVLLDEALASPLKDAHFFEKTTSICSINISTTHRCVRRASMRSSARFRLSAVLAVAAVYFQGLPQLLEVRSHPRRAY